MSALDAAEQRLRKQFPNATRTELAAKMMAMRFPGATEESAQAALLEMLMEVGDQPQPGGPPKKMTYIEGAGPVWRQRMEQTFRGLANPIPPDLPSAIEDAVRDAKLRKPRGVTM